MKIVLSKREGKKGSELTALRCRGDIPAVIYAKGIPSDKVVVNGAAFDQVRRSIAPGCLSSQVFDLEFGERSLEALIKEIDYHPTTYRVEHIGFLILQEKVPITVAIPIICSGQNECIGIKLGGFLRQVKRAVMVRCLRKNMPNRFTIDVSGMKVGDSVRVKDLEIGDGVCCLASPQDVLTVVAQR